MMTSSNPATQSLKNNEAPPQVPPPPYPGYNGYFDAEPQQQQQQQSGGMVVVKGNHGNPHSSYFNPACGEFDANTAAVGATAAGGSGADAELGAVGFTMRGLEDRDIRRAFIRKVYLILFAQLLVTFTIVVVFSIVSPVRKFARGNFWLFHVSYAIFFVTYIALVCVTPLRRKFPGNFISLAIFTGSLSFMAGVIASSYETNTVLICLAITAAVCLSVTIFAVQTRFDFTMCSGLLFGLSLVVFFFGIACTVTFAVYRGDPSASMKLKILDCVYGGLLALVFVLFLVFDTQRVVGGRRHNLSEEEYVFGAMQIYVDVVYIFIILLGFSRQ